MQLEKWRRAPRYSGDTPEGFVQVTNQPGPEDMPFYLNTNGHIEYTVPEWQADSLIRRLNRDGISSH